MDYHGVLRFVAEHRGAGLPHRNYLPPLLDALDHPERGLRGVTVTGTNGKGSTCALAVAGLAAMGLRVGSMPGPHLQEPTERIRVNNVAVTRAEYAAAYSEVADALRRVSEPVNLSTLQAAAAAAHYRRAGVDLAVLEAAVGGRDTAVASFDTGVKVLTNVGLDHTEILGATHAEIARAKAGVVRDGDHVILGDLSPQAMAAAREVLAERSGLTVWRLGREIRTATSPRDASGHAGADGAGTGVDVVTPGDVHHGLTCPLPGPHQHRNLALAVAGIDALRERGLVAGFTPERLRSGLAAVRWPARLELVRPAYLDGWSGSVLLDSAHNPHGVAAALPEVLRMAEAASHPVLVSSDANKGMAEILRSLPPQWAMVVVHSRKPAAAATHLLAQHAARPGLHHAPTVPDALRRATRIAGAGNLVAVLDLLVAGETRTLLGLPPG